MEESVGLDREARFCACVLCLCGSYDSLAPRDARRGVLNWSNGGEFKELIGTTNYWYHITTSYRAVIEHRLPTGAMEDKR